MNSIHLVGNVGQNPSLRETNGGTPVANVTLATNRVYKDAAGQRQQSTEWHRLVVWGEGAKNFAEIVGKGDLVAVRGRLEYRAREIAGEKVKDAVIRIQEWYQLTPRKARADEEAQPNAPADGGEGGDTFPADGDIPFGGEVDIPAGGGEPGVQLGSGEPGPPLGESQPKGASIGAGDLPAATDLQPTEPVAAEPITTAPGEELPSEPEPSSAGDAPATHRRGRKK